jgi:hypothetical protein
LKWKKCSDILHLKRKFGKNGVNCWNWLTISGVALSYTSVDAVYAFYLTLMKSGVGWMDGIGQIGWLDE